MHEFLRPAGSEGLRVELFANRCPSTWRAAPGAPWCWKTASGLRSSRHEQGVEIVQGDLSYFEAVSEALQGITAAYFVFPVKVPGLLEATAFFAQAALEQGVEAIVNTSQISARRSAKSHAAQNHWIAERLLDRSGIPVTHLRPTFFAECLMYVSESIREKNMFPLPFGDARYAPIAAEDQGRVIAAILNDSAEHDLAV